MNVQGVNSLISAPLQAQAANSTAVSGATGSSGSGGGTSSTDLQTMFLNLLVTELQNQDPTQPVDPTQMVGQMISLNQLDQLISINQILSGLGAPPTSSGSAVPGQPGSGAQSIVSHRVNGSPLPHAGAPGTPLAFQYPANTSAAVLGSAMNLYNLYGNPGAPATALNRFTPLGGK